MRVVRLVAVLAGIFLAIIALLSIWIPYDIILGALGVLLALGIGFVIVLFVWMGIGIAFINLIEFIGRLLKALWNATK